jgi:hypothetical protein
MLMSSPGDRFSLRVNHLSSVNLQIEVFLDMALDLPRVFSWDELFECVVCDIDKLLDCLMILLSSLDDLILDV